MEKIRQFMKKNIAITIIAISAIVLILIIGVPLLINWIFKIPALCDFFAVNWEAKDALSYYGDALGFLGTVIFSGLALWQNHVIQQANDKHTQILEQMEIVKNAPHIIAKSNMANGNASNLKIQIKNISENIAEKIFVYGFAIIDETGLTLWRREDVISVDYLVGERVWEIYLENPSVASNKHQIVFDIKYCDKFGTVHACKAVGGFGERVGIPSFKITEL